MVIKKKIRYFDSEYCFGGFFQNIQKTDYDFGTLINSFTEMYLLKLKITSPEIELMTDEELQAGEC